MQPIRQCPYSILVMTNSKGNQAIMAASSLSREKFKKGKYLYRKVKIKMGGLVFCPWMLPSLRTLTSLDSIKTNRKCLDNFYKDWIPVPKGTSKSNIVST